MVTLVDVNSQKELGRQLTLNKSKNKAEGNNIPVSNNSRAPINKDSQASLLNYYNTALTAYVTISNIRGQMLQRDLAYYRETDQTVAQQRAQGYNAAGDASKIQNVTIPIVMPQVESAVAYQTSVFLTGYPIFGIVAPPAFATAGAQMETIIGENSIRAGWPQELIKTIRNGYKYDLGAVEVVWETKKTYNIGTPDIKELTVGSVEETQYAGNFIKDLDPYNLILDTRVSPDRNHIEGEVAGYTELLSPVAMKQRMDELDLLSTMNFREAFESPSTGAGTATTTTAGYYQPQFNPGALLNVAVNQPFSWNNFFAVANNRDNGRGIQYQSSYEWTVLYVRMIPSVFGIYKKNPNHVQIWKFIIVNRSVVIFAKQMDNAHNYLPIVVCKPSNDGMKWQSKSFAQNAEPFQYVASALTNSAIESQRRKVYDRIFYDPSRVAKKDIDNVSSVARIPVKNSQYNKDIASAIHVSPYRDEGVSDILQFSQNVTQMAEIANGQNRVQQGQFQKGNKTKREFETVMGNANSRQQMVSIALEYTFFTPIKEIIKSNILQYQPPTMLTNSKTNEEVAIDPAALRKAILSFKVSDGLLPTSKLVSDEVFNTIFQTAQAMPEVRAQYDIMGMFNYQMALQGVEWLSDFKRTDEEAAKQLQLMTQAANAAASKPPEQNPQPQPRQ